MMIILTPEFIWSTPWNSYCPFLFKIFSLSTNTPSALYWAFYFALYKKENNTEDVTCQCKNLGLKSKNFFKSPHVSGVTLIAKFCVNIAFFEYHTHFSHIVASPYAK